LGDSRQGIGFRARQKAHNGALDNRKVRRKSLLRSVKRTRGLNPSAKVVKSGQKAWSNGKSALLVQVSA
jgi:hypothetical protein